MPGQRINSRLVTGTFSDDIVQSPIGRCDGTNPVRLAAMRPDETHAFHAVGTRVRGDTRSDPAAPWLTAPRMGGSARW